jgi:hypothetical protein
MVGIVIASARQSKRWERVTPAARTIGQQLRTARKASCCGDRLADDRASMGDERAGRRSRLASKFATCSEWQFSADFGRTGSTSTGEEQTSMNPRTCGGDEERSRGDRHIGRDGATAI